MKEPKSVPLAYSILAIAVNNASYQSDMFIMYLYKRVYYHSYFSGSPLVRRSVWLMLMLLMNAVMVYFYIMALESEKGVIMFLNALRIERF